MMKPFYGKVAPGSGVVHDCIHTQILSKYRQIRHTLTKIELSWLSSRILKDCRLFWIQPQQVVGCVEKLLLCSVLWTQTPP